MRKQLFFFALAILSAVSCQNEPKVSASAMPSAPASPKPEVYIYTAVVDKLNLRDQPNKNGKVVAQFAEGDFAEGTGVLSKNKEEATLRGILYNEPYLQLTTTTPEQHQGWAYRPGLITVYAGPRSTSPDLGKLTQLNNHLKGLSVTKLDSGKKALDYVKQAFAGSKGTLADAVYILTLHFLTRMEREEAIYMLAENQRWADADYEAIYREKFDMNKYPVTRSFAENGFRLETGEGAVFPVVDLAKLSDFFATKVTPPMKLFMQQNISEQKEQLWSDGGIIIPLEQVADRAAWWEKFNNDNPYFVLSHESKLNENNMILTLISGANNTPVFDYESGAVVPEYRKVWDYVQQKYAGTRLAKRVRAFTDLCAAEGWKRSEKIEQYQIKLAEELYEL
jgi:hypothetical protein